MLRRHGPQALDRRVHQVAHVERGALEREPAVLGHRQRLEIVDQMGEQPHLLSQGAQCLGARRDQTVFDRLDLSPQVGERRAQLVRDVGDQRAAQRISWRASESAMVLNACDSSPISSRDRTVTRCARSPRPSRRAASVSAPTGSRIRRDRSQASASATRPDTAAASIRRRSNAAPNARGRASGSSCGGGRAMSVPIEVPSARFTSARGPPTSTIAGVRGPIAAPHTALERQTIARSERRLSTRQLRRGCAEHRAVGPDQHQLTTIGAPQLGEPGVQMLETLVLGQPRGQELGQPLDVRRALGHLEAPELDARGLTG